MHLRAGDPRINDRPGLTGDLSAILANLDIGVEDMECKRFTMEGIGDTVF